VNPFTDPVWLAEARAWIESQVEVSGEIEQPHVRAWATALRVPTPEGPVWFKAARDEFAFEAALLELLTQLAPDLVTDVIASRPGAGWLLMADAGERAREQPIDWTPLQRRYAELQIAAIDHADAMLALGTFDLRTERLPSLTEELFPCLQPATAERLSDGLPRIHELFAQLASSPLPATIEHADLHDANVFVRDGHVRILDWGDANVAHPLVSLTVEMDERARPAYLAPWTAFAPLARLEADAAVVLELRYLLRAINWLKVVRYDRDRAIAGIDDRVNWFFDGVPGDGT
jgi:hypothetical protein